MTQYFRCDFKDCKTEVKYNNFDEGLRVRQGDFLLVTSYFLCHEHAQLLERVIKKEGEEE
jgi:hypothetical protein